VRVARHKCSTVSKLHIYFRLNCRTHAAALSAAITGFIEGTKTTAYATGSGCCLEGGTVLHCQKEKIWPSHQPAGVYHRRSHYIYILLYGIFHFPSSRVGQRCLYSGGTSRPSKPQKLTVFFVGRHEKRATLVFLNVADMSAETSIGTKVPFEHWYPQ
jgi:hypothetical protein